MTISNLEITFTPHVDLSKIVPPPSEYQLFTAKKWGDPILVEQANLDTAYVDTSNFQVIPVLVKEAKTFSAVSKYSLLERSKGDIDALQQLQPLDGATMAQKMNVLVYPGKGARTMWTNNAMYDWQNASAYYAGTQLWGGQMLAATIETFDVPLTYPSGQSTVASCRKVLAFRQADWVKSFEQYPYLINRYTVAYRLPEENTYSETFGGIIRLVPMQCLDPQDFKFAGGLVPSAYYVPAQWLETVNV